MDINDLVDRLINPSQDPDEMREAMAHAARLILLMQNRIKYLCDIKDELQDEVDRLSFDLGIKERGYVR